MEMCFPRLSEACVWSEAATARGCGVGSLAFRRGVLAIDETCEAESLDLGLYGYGVFEGSSGGNGFLKHLMYAVGYGGGVSEDLIVRCRALADVHVCFKGDLVEAPWAEARMLCGVRGFVFPPQRPRRIRRISLSYLGDRVIVHLSQDDAEEEITVFPQSAEE
jgi:hypothetical protein